MNEIAGFVSRYLFSSGPGLADRVAATALVFEGTAAGAGGVAPDLDVFRANCRLRWVNDLGNAEVGGHFFCQCGR